MPSSGFSSNVMPGKLRTFAPFDQLPPDQLILAASHASQHRYADGFTLLTQGCEDDHEYFLVSGQLALSNSAGHGTVITGGTPESKVAVAPFRPSLYEVRVVGAVLCIKMLRAEVDALRTQCLPPDDGDVDDLSLDATIAHEYMSDFRHDLNAGKVALPSVPAIALRIRRCVADPNSSSESVAHAVAADPAIAAKLLKVANSPLCRGSAPIERLPDAITRIGLGTVTELVIFFTISGLYKSKLPVLQQKLAAIVDEALHLSALTSVIADRNPGLERERARVAGLLSNLGCLPIYDYAASNPAYMSNPEIIDRVVRRMSCEVAGLIAEHWKLSEAMQQAVSHSRDWGYDAGGGVALVDAVIGARYHHELSIGRIKDLPKPDRVPALVRLFGAQSPPELSIEILGAAKRRQQALRFVVEH